MNEGKPTKAGGADDVIGSGAHADDADGDFELRAPQDTAAVIRDDPPSPGSGATGPTEPSGPTGESGTEGDFELARPGTPTTPPVGETGAGAPLGSNVSAAATERPEKRPEPLHDPDPYSTPPYGEPGPWAPAPPVQHPAATPAQGTAVPAPPGAPVPSQGVAQAPPAAPPSQAPEPAPAPVPASAPAPAPMAAPAADAPASGIPGPDAPAPPPTPWQNYDPWAPVAAAPLQQTGEAVLSKEQRRRRVRKALAGAAVLLALVAGGVGGAVGAYLERNGGIGEVELPQAGPEPAGRAPDSVAGIAARALPSVVTLHVSGAGEQGTGTGFVLDDRGHVLTNNHVVEPAGADGEITVTFHSGDTAKATVVGRDSGYDLAVVRVSGVSGLKPLPLGNSENVQVGDPVVAIGAPYDLEGTVTSGIISAKERPITAGGESEDGSDVSYVDALQTDAPINPGNSGGPLLDTRGRVVGINSAIRSAGGGSAPESGQAGSIGLGFAIPINQGKRVAEELINTGKATHPVIGVTLDMEYSGDGARVGTKGNDGGPAVTVGGPGARAGIKAGDVVTAVDGRRIHSGDELIVKVRAHRPGDRLELTLERDGRERTISLVLGSSDGD
ncbi:protease [Streptomyces lincolnensis]|uniref:Protease n=1 Tax=Streptomyces lincolnensis TaxID=1915 RepID=A0A1B1MGK6_STRLN|nr:trypsin-like peptidase domain-containing protein [Streptomyces lincolnensis]ANS67755.1 protease [Streptomyces lincolnensis]AXG54039.1 protease [Streptomyces lincolnensis]QMV09415.1 PDZ domain-containing protein [Streptomyces lincolnensis]